MMESISSGKAFVASLVAGVPTVTFAAITGESVSVAIGAGTAVLMFLFSIRNTANEQYVKGLHQQIQDAYESQKKDRAEHLSELGAIKMQLSDVQVQLHAFQTNGDQAKKVLAGHSCPAAADPTLKCRLPETLSSLL
jgi:uncharacterized membrane protein YgaE (UPF0421/DUF939 family)